MCIEKWTAYTRELKEEIDRWEEKALVFHSEHHYLLWLLVSAIKGATNGWTSITAERCFRIGHFSLTQLVLINPFWFNLCAPVRKTSRAAIRIVWRLICSAQMWLCNWRSKRKKSVIISLCTVQSHTHSTKQTVLGNTIIDQSTINHY